MKTKLLILTAAAAMSNLAVAETTTTTATTVLASADAANVAANSSVASSLDEFAALKIGYEGILNGPSADFANGRRVGNNDLFASNRFKFKTNINDDIDVAFQPRIRTTFTQSGLIGAMENFRISSNIKNLLKSDVGSLTVTPRVALPTSIAAHNDGMLPSPELILQYGIEPKNSRFTFNVGVQTLNLLYNSAAVRSNGQTQFVGLGIMEAAYQLSPKTKLSAGFYPEMTKNADLAMTTSSNELDLGIAIDISKTWTLNPYLATEFNNVVGGNVGGNVVDNRNGLLRNTGVCLVVSGAIL